MQAYHLMRIVLKLMEEMEDVIVCVMTALLYCCLY